MKLVLMGLARFGAMLGCVVVIERGIHQAPGVWRVTLLSVGVIGYRHAMNAFDKWRDLTP